ncbi:MAG TPA: diguanylate cyclase [Ruminiclostridium sp.]|nr:diguanylate cyclase [Ruminiclostridium sp.]
MSRILVVDDSPFNQKMISEILVNEYELVVTGDGRTAIQLADEKKPDLILLDILMPEMDGLEVCRFLKSQTSTAEIPIIFITAASEPEDVVKGLEAGGQDYITKPFSSSVLRARIKIHLELEDSKKALKAYAKELEQKYIELNEALSKLEVVAMTDYLTALPNRYYMINRINDEVLRIQQAQGVMSLVLMDINGFKGINDTYGHNCGDFVLREIARIMKENTRKTDVISRWGGDEFLLLLPNASSNEGQITAKKLKETIDAAIINYEGQVIRLTVTLGVTEFDPDLDIDANIKKADEALYQGKQLLKSTVPG